MPSPFPWPCLTRFSILWLLSYASYGTALICLSFLLPMTWLLSGGKYQDTFHIKTDCSYVLSILPFYGTMSGGLFSFLFALEVPFSLFKIIFLFINQMKLLSIRENCISQGALAVGWMMTHDLSLMDWGHFLAPHEKSHILPCLCGHSRWEHPCFISLCKFKW